MAESEKRVRVAITGDASGLNKEFKRVQTDAKEAFKDIGLDKALDNAEKQFAKIGDRIKAVNQILKDHKKDSDTEFDSRTKHATTRHDVNRVKEDKIDADNLQNEAWIKWQKLADYFTQSIKDKRIDEQGNPMLQPNPEDDNNGRPGLGHRAIMRTIAGGRLNLAGGAHEVVAGEGGLAESAGLGAMGIAITSALTIAIAAAIGKSLQLGLQQYRTENTIAGKFDIDRNTFGTGENELGLSNNEYKQFIFQQAKSRMSATDIQEISKNRLTLEKARGLDDTDVSRLDQFRQQGGQETGRVIVDILSRAEKGGILGITKTDFTLLPQKIEQVANIMSMQKANSGTVDTEAALNLISAGTKIGGRFATDQASEAFGRIDASIKNPSSPGARAFIFEELRKANPNAKYTDIKAMMEKGLTGDNLKAIMPDIERIPQGEFRRLLLASVLTQGNQIDANQLDKDGNLNKLTSGLRQRGISDKEFADKSKDIENVAEGKVDVVSKIGAHISSWGAAFGHAFVGAVDDDYNNRKASGPFSGIAGLGVQVGLNFASSLNHEPTKNTIKKK